MVPPNQPRITIAQTSIYTTWKCFHTSRSFSWKLIFEKFVFLLYFYVKFINQHCSRNLFLVTMTWTFNNWECLRISYRFCRWLVYERKIFTYIFFKTNKPHPLFAAYMTVWHPPPNHCSPILTPWIMIWINFNLHYLSIFQQ